MYDSVSFVVWWKLTEILSSKGIDELVGDEVRCFGSEE